MCMKHLVPCLAHSKCSTEATWDDVVTCAVVHVTERFSQADQGSGRHQLRGLVSSPRYEGVAMTGLSALSLFPL